MKKKFFFMLFFFSYVYARTNGQQRQWTDTDIIPKHTKIKGNHILELRNEVDLKRSSCGLSPFLWTDTSLTRIKIRKIHIEQLRQAINEAYSASSKPTFDFGAAINAQNTKVSKNHITDLRVAIDNISCAVNGLCGNANNATYSSAPTSGLCQAGTPSSVSGAGPWSWLCNGSGGGYNVSCATRMAGPPLPPVVTPPSSICGPTHATYVVTSPTSGLCSSGTASAVSWVYFGAATQAGVYRWTCISGSINESCQASSPPCIGSGTKTWSVGSQTCTGSYFGSNVWTINQNYPLPSGQATYSCQSDGLWSSVPSSVTCEAVPQTCPVALDTHWGSGGVCYKYTPGNGVIPHGANYTYTSQTNPGSWTVRCNNGTIVTVSQTCN